MDTRWVAVAVADELDGGAPCAWVGETEVSCAVWLGDVEAGDVDELFVADAAMVEVTA